MSDNGNFNWPLLSVFINFWSAAFHDGIIRTKPLERIRNIERDEEGDFADPFTLEELNRIQVRERNNVTIKEEREGLFGTACLTPSGPSSLCSDVPQPALQASVEPARVLPTLPIGQ